MVPSLEEAQEGLVGTTAAARGQSPWGVRPVVAMKACGRCWPVGDGAGYMAMCPCDGFTYVGHGGGPQPSLVVVPWETTVVLLFLPPLPPLRRLLFLCRLLLLPLLLSGPLPLFLPGGRGGDSGADNVLLE
jgi:hypothetical protein